MPQYVVDLAQLEPLDIVVEKCVERGDQDGHAGVGETGREHER